jgi:hypothetical protein
MSRAFVRRLLREPLLHFFLLGAVLFGLYGWLHGGLGKAPDEIVVSRGQLQTLHRQFQLTRQRAPTPQELRELVDSWVREEILYREGIAMGLDRDDSIVRRRVAQKLEFISQEATPAMPTAQDLQAWLDAHPTNYLVEARYSLRQVYFNPQRRGDRLQADAAAARRALQFGQPVNGDATMLPATLQDARAFEVTRTFGSEFAQALETLPVGSWQGPVRSAFGLHLVLLTAREPGRRATLDEMRAPLERDWLQARTQAAQEAFFKRLRAKYSVRIEAADGAHGGREAAVNP